MVAELDKNPWWHRMLVRPVAFPCWGESAAPCYAPWHKYVCELLWHCLSLQTHPVQELRPHACLLSAVASWHKCDGHRPVRQKRQPAAHVEASGGIQGSCAPNNAESRRRGPLYLLLSRSLSAYHESRVREGGGGGNGISLRLLISLGMCLLSQSHSCKECPGTESAL